MKYAAVIIAILGVLSVPTGFAAIDTQQAYQDQRADYLRAKQLRKSGNIKQYVKLKKQLRDYPLYPYLEYAELSANLSNANSRQISQFIEQYQHLAVTQRLRARWLKQLGKNKKWKDYLGFYDDTLADTQLRCYYLRSRLQQGKPEDVWPLVPSLWVVGHSQPKACDPLFDQWLNAGKRTREHTWNRLKMAMSKSNISLANYLTGLMTGADKRAAEKFLSFHRQPAQVKKRGVLSVRSSQDADIALHAIRRLARSDTMAAAKSLSTLGSMRFNAADLAEAQKSLAFHILSKPSRTGLDWIRKQLTPGVDPDVAVYAARIALVFEHWQTVLMAIEHMPESLQKTNRWQYWHAKASMQENPQLDDVWKHNAFAELAKQRDYYGFLSALLLERSFDFNDHAISFSPDFQTQIKQIPGLEIALELYAAGELVSARREWRHALLELPATHMIAAAHIAQDWGWASQAVLTTIMARSWDELSLRFPLSYREYMHRGARMAGIELSWAYAIARQESAMNPAATSHAGAKGLMQLMPGTAKETVKRNALPVKAQDLHNEKVNSMIGTAHLGELSRLYGGNRILSSAAYNAGKHRANAWLKRSSRAQAFDVWIDTIPFKETRNYVQNVLMFAAIYDYRLENDVEFIKTNEWVINR